MNRVSLALAALAITPTLALAQGDAPNADLESGPHQLVKAADIVFEPFEVPGFDPGIQLAVIHGDPMGAEGDYTVQLKFPDGYRFPAHYHPRAEHVTVLSGTFRLGMGETPNDEALVTYAPGSFLYIPAENPHFGGVTGETKIQLHGMAPFEIILVEASSAAYSGQ